MPTPAAANTSRKFCCIGVDVKCAAIHPVSSGASSAPALMPM